MISIRGGIPPAPARIRACIAARYWPACVRTPHPMNLDAEWLEPDGCGGFASGTVGGVRSRRYHALLLPATRPPVARMALVNGLESASNRRRRVSPLHPVLSRWRGGATCSPRAAWISSPISAPTPGRAGPSSSPTAPAWNRKSSSTRPAARPRSAGGCSPLRRQRRRHPGSPPAVFRARLSCAPPRKHRLRLPARVRTTKPATSPGRRTPDCPLTRVWTNGTYRHEPAWYRQFLYTAERERGSGLTWKTSRCPAFYASPWAVTRSPS